MKLKLSVAHRWSSFFCITIPDPFLLWLVWFDSVMPSLYPIYCYSRYRFTRYFDNGKTCCFDCDFLKFHRYNRYILTTGHFIADTDCTTELWDWSQCHFTLLLLVLQSYRVQSISKMLSLELSIKRHWRSESFMNFFTQTGSLGPYSTDFKILKSCTVFKFSARFAALTGLSWVFLDKCFGVLADNTDHFHYYRLYKLYAF